MVSSNFSSVLPSILPRAITRAESVAGAVMQSGSTLTEGGLSDGHLFGRGAGPSQPGRIAVDGHDT